VATPQDLAKAFAVDTTGALGRTTFSATRDLAPFPDDVAATSTPDQLAPIMGSIARAHVAYAQAAEPALEAR